MHETLSRVLSFPQRASAGDEALLGPSEAVGRLWSQIRRIAPHFRAALVMGERGAGAETAAHALHALSPVSALPFFILEAGVSDRKFSAIGMVFLPNPERLPLPTQRLLVRKLRQRPHTLRMVAALSSDLRACVSAGRIHTELADALSAVRLDLPPLRERAADIPVIACQMAHRIAERKGVATPMLTDGFFRTAAAFPWPGNVTQLNRVLEHLISQTNLHSSLCEDHLMQAIAAAGEPQTSEAAPRMVRLEEVVQEHIRSVLIGCHGNKLRAAEVLGISRSTLYRMLDAHTGARPEEMLPAPV